MVYNADGFRRNIETRKCGMAVYRHDVVVAGAGLAGMRAALEGPSYWADEVKWLMKGAIMICGAPIQGRFQP